MGLMISVIFTVIGGLAAGLVGYIATIVSLRERRREKHFEEHKNNLQAISKALDHVYAEVWILVGSPDELKLPKSPFGNMKRVTNLEIKNEPIAMELQNAFSAESRPIQMGIDSVLYDDIPAHFSNLHQMLEKTEKAVKDHGAQIIKLLNSISNDIYEKLECSNIEFPPTDGNKNIPEKFCDLNNEIIEMDYAGCIFLILIGEEEDSWPNKVRWLKNNNLYDEFKKLAIEVINELGNYLDQLSELSNNISQDINKAKEEINKIDHMTKLKGRCRYL